MTPAHTVIAVSDASQVGEARRAAQRVAGEAGLSETDAGRVGIIATELATNLVRHAGVGGEVLVTACGGTMPSVEILAVDRGAGMADVNRCIQDGYSTGGTPGTGLGAIGRLSNEFDLYSSPAGTAIWSRVIPGTPAHKPWTPTAQRWGAVSVSAPGETVCGDTWSVAESDGRISVMIADGLGHGPLAAEASIEACQLFDKSPFNAIHTLLEGVHGALASTRGAAVAIASIDPSAGKLKFGGVGNISGTLLLVGGSSRGLFSHNGTVGHQVRKVQEFEYPWGPNAILVMHSDGLQTRWELEKYPGLLRRHPAVIAAVLYRDFKRGRDDATVVVVSALTGGG